MRIRSLAAPGVLVLAGAACGGAPASRTVSSMPGQFRLDEWAITADEPVLPAGRQEITATNVGHQTHELVIVRASDAASLPTKADGSVDEDQLDRVKVGEIPDVPAGASRHTTLDLSSGAYVAFCNIVGGMASGGMAPWAEACNEHTSNSACTRRLPSPPLERRCRCARTRQSRAIGKRAVFQALMPPLTLYASRPTSSSA